MAWRRAQRAVRRAPRALMQYINASKIFVHDGSASCTSLVDDLRPDGLAPSPDAAIVAPLSTVSRPAG